jgi:hypothetical protein
MNRTAAALVALLALTACADPAAPPPIPAAQMTDNDRTALRVCRARGQIVGAQTLGQGAVASVFAENRAANACWNAYRVTGVMPVL